MTTLAASYSGASAAGRPRKFSGAPHGRPASRLSTEGDGRHHGRPPPVVAAFRRRGDVQRLHDLAGEHPLLLALVPVLLGIERHAEHGGEHRGGEVLGVVAGYVATLTVAVMLGDVAVMR